MAFSSSLRTLSMSCWELFAFRIDYTLILQPKVDITFRMNVMNGISVQPIVIQCGGNSMAFRLSQNKMLAHCFRVLYRDKAILDFIWIVNVCVGAHLMKANSILDDSVNRTVWLDF